MQVENLHQSRRTGETSNGACRRFAYLSELLMERRHHDIALDSWIQGNRQLLVDCLVDSCQRGIVQRFAAHDVALESGWGIGFSRDLDDAQLVQVAFLI